MAGEQRGKLSAATLFVYMLIVESIFTTLLFVVIVSSGRMGPIEALEKAGILFVFFLVADSVAIGLYVTVAHTFVSLLYPVRQGEFEGLHRQADKLAGAKEFDEAVALYREWIERHPKDVEARFELARLLRGPMRRPEGAVEALTAALDVQPAKAWMVKTLEELADIYASDLSRPAQAAAMYKVVSEYYPGTPEADRAKKRAASLLDQT